MLRRAVLGTVVALTALGSLLSGPAVAASTPPPTAAPPVADLQSPGAAPTFVGKAVKPRPVAPRPKYTPSVSFMHADSGNSGTFDTPGPLGESPIVSSSQTLSLSPFMWGRDGTLTAGCNSTDDAGVLRSCLAAVDPQTAAIEARWFAPDGQKVNAPYMVMDAKQRVYAPTIQRHIFVVQRSGPPTDPAFSVIRDVDLTDTLQSNEVLLGVLPDTAGNIWFTTGGIIGNGDVVPPFTTLGYVTPSGKIRTMHVDQQIVENGISVDGTTMYVDTGPAGAGDHAGATGYLFALTSDEKKGAVRTVWKESYDAGSTLKPGGFARGSGSSVTLLGSKYVTITDNADDQVHVLVYKRGTSIGKGPRQVCKTPIFQPGASAVDIAGITVKNGNTHSVMLANIYNAPPIIKTAAGFTGTDNNVHQMAPGFTRVDVNANGKGCHVVWTAPIRVKDVPSMSTKTGLVYAYMQDDALAQQGQYVWYFIAIDYRTGKVVWKQLAGAGGYKNDDYASSSLGPDGTLYQNLPLGVVWMRDQ